MISYFNNKNLVFYNLYRNKYIFFFVIKFILQKKKKKWSFFYYFFFLCLNFFFYMYNNHFYISKGLKLNNINYLSKLYNVIYKNRIFSTFIISPFSFNNSYFFWYFFNKDNWIQLFINIFMKKGKKYSSYQNIYKLFFFIKKLIGYNPIFILKKSLYKNRFLFDIQQLKLRKKTLIIPKLLSLKSQLSKSIKYLLNNSSLKSLKIVNQKKNLSYFQKITYLLLNNLFIVNRLKKLILKESLIVKNNFYHIKKENYLNKYLSEMENNNVLKKKSFFKKKYKSYDKKDKFLKFKLNQLRFLKLKLEEKKLFLFSRFNLNLQSKTKLKCKWF